jgi:PAS domain S-box-containing protein
MRSGKKEAAPQRSRSEADTIWATALRAAAAVARQAASSEEDVLSAVTDEFERLDLRSGISLLQPDGTLIVRAVSINPTVTRVMERAAGIKILNYRFDPETVDVYKRAIESGEAAFTSDRAITIAQIMPKSLQTLTSLFLRLMGEENVIVAPLKQDTNIIGTLNVAASWLTPDDCQMVAALADHIAIAISHVRSRQEMQRSLNRERLRNRVAEALTSALDLPIVLERILQLALEMTGAEAGTVMLLDPTRTRLTFPYMYGLPQELAQRPLERGVGTIWDVINSRETKLVENYPSHPNAAPAGVEQGLRVQLGLPLLYEGDILGAMELLSRDKNFHFTAEQIEDVESVARMAAIAIRNAQLYTNEIRRSAESQALIATAQAISSSLDLNTVLQEIAERSSTLLQADGSHIHLVNEETQMLECAVALGVNADALADFQLKVGEGLIGSVVVNGEPLLSNNPATDPRAVVVPGTEEDEEEGLIMAPLTVRQRTMGAMAVRRDGTDRPFTPADLSFLTALAAQAAVAIENAHLYGQIEAQAHRLENQVVERTADLAFSEARFRSLVETSIAGIIQVDQTGTIAYVNRAFCDMLKFGPDELLRQKIGDLGIFEDDRQEVDQFVLNWLEGEETAAQVYELVLTTRDQQKIPCLVGVSLIEKAGSGQRGLTGFVLDISDHKELERQLQAERDRLNAILENIGDAVVVTDREGVISFVNPAWERLNGYSADEALGKTPRIISSGQHDQPFYAEMWETILSGNTWRGEVVNRRKDGSLYDAAVTITPLVAENGVIINMVGVQYDISALKELDRLKSQFVSDVSHELRTPLTNIRLYLDLLDKDNLSAKEHNYMATLMRESERLAHLIDDLLSLSRLDAGATPVAHNPIDINKLCNALVSDRQTLAANRGLDLSFQPSHALPEIKGDHRLLSQVFTNLLTNAMNYTTEGGTIKVSTRALENNEGEWVVIDFQDSGLGISPDEQPMIFRRFYRGAASRATNSAGTGLGLAICQQIAELHGGRVTVSSKGHKKGSLFSVWLPSDSQD